MLTDSNGTFRLVVATAVAIVVLVTLAPGTVGAIDSCADDVNSPGLHVVNSSISDGSASTCIEINANDVILDGQGNSIDGLNKSGGSVGIDVSSQTNVTIKNLGNVTRWNRGIQVSDSSNVTLTNNTANNNNRAGIFFETSTGGDLSENTVNDNGKNGIRLRAASDNELIGNTANDNGNYGIRLDANSDSNDVFDNTANNNGPAGIRVNTGSSNNELVDNTADNNDDDGIRLRKSSNGNNLTDNKANNNGNDGILVTESNGTDLINNNVSSNDDDGINVVAAERTNITDNTVFSNSDDGIILASASNNDIIDNDVSQDVNEGIELTAAAANDEGFGTTAPSSMNDILDNTVVTSQDNGIELDNSANNNTVLDNTVFGSENGIELDQGANDNDLIGNNVSQNNANGILLTSESGNNPSDNNNLTDNTANNNGNNGIWIEFGNNNNLTDNTANNNGNNGIYLGGQPPDEANGNELVDNTANGNGGSVPTSVEEQVSTQQLYGSGNSGIYLRNADDNIIEGTKAHDNLNNGIWLEQAEENNLTDTAARFNVVSGIYLGGISGFANDNTLVNNTATGSEYGIWIRNSFGNSVSESLAEDNYEGIVVVQEPLRFREIGSESVEATGNTFTDDTSRNNLWDFVVFTGSGGNNGIILGDSVSDYPVTNLNIGDSTNPDTTLSFNADNMELKGIDSPESDPADLTNIGRYFEAKTLEGGNSIESNGELEISQTGDSFLDVSLSYENSDVSGVDEPTLELLRFNDTADEWQDVPGSTVDTGNNLASANITQFSDFGVFGEPGQRCINRRDLGRGQEESECPFDRDIERGGTREGLDRDTGRGGTGEHRDSATSRRNRGRGR